MTTNLLTSVCHLKQKLFCFVRVIVEIAKREWPQLWPNLFPKLFEIANSSDLALLVLRRMAEDVVTLQVGCFNTNNSLVFVSESFFLFT